MIHHSSVFLHWILSFPLTNPAAVRIHFETTGCCYINFLRQTLQVCHETGFVNNDLQIIDWMDNILEVWNQRPLKHFKVRLKDQDTWNLKSSAVPKKVSFPDYQHWIPGICMFCWQVKRPSRHLSWMHMISLVIPQIGSHRQLFEEVLASDELAKCATWMRI